MLVIKQFRQLMPLFMMIMMVRRNNCLYGAATEWDGVCKLVEWTCTWGPVSDSSCYFLLSQDSFSSWWPLQSHTRTQRFLNIILSWWLCCQKFFFLLEEVLEWDRQALPSHSFFLSGSGKKGPAFHPHQQLPRPIAGSHTWHSTQSTENLEVSTLVPGTKEMNMSNRMTSDQLRFPHWCQAPGTQIWTNGWLLTFRSLQ